MQSDPTTGRLYLDNTILSSVAECDTRFLMRHGLNWASEAESAPLLSGQAAHETLAHFMRAYGHMQQRGRPFSAKAGQRLIGDCLDIFEGHYGAFAREKVPDGDRLSLQNTSDVLKGWLEKHVHHRFPFKVYPDLVEIGFAVPLDSEGHFVFCGRLDALVQAPDGQWYVLDHKTTGRMDGVWTAAWRMGSQFSGYHWAAQLHTKMPVAGTYINAIEFSKLPGGQGQAAAPRLKKDGTPYKTKECAEHATSYAECRLQHVKHQLTVTTRTPQALEAWRRSAIQLAYKAERLMSDFDTVTKVAQAGMQQGMFTKACVWCDFKDWCGSDRPVQYVRGMFAQREWKPFELVKQQGETT